MAVDLDVSVVDSSTSLEVVALTRVDSVELRLGDVMGTLPVGTATLDAAAACEPREEVMVTMGDEVARETSDVVDAVEIDPSTTSITEVETAAEEALVPAAEDDDPDSVTLGVAREEAGSVADALMEDSIEASDSAILSEG